MQRARLVALGLCLSMLLLGQPIVGERAIAMVTCEFSGGFATLRDRIPDAVGGCVENERTDPATGNAEQRTTLGLLTWRKADGLVTYSDGVTTWLLLKGELFKRANADPPFPWEAAVGAPGAAATPGVPATARNIRLTDSFDAAGGDAFPRSSTSPGVSFGYVDGEYAVRWDLPQSGFQAISSLFRYYDAGVSVDVRLVGEVEGRAAMLMCRNQGISGLSGYVFAFQPATGEVVLGRFDRGEYVDLVASQASSAVQRGTASNHLELECSGSTISGSVNGQAVASARDTTYAGGKASVGVGAVGGPTSLEARFDNFVVWESPPPGRPGRMVDDEGYRHAAQDALIPYRHDPPSSGRHYALATAAGVYAEPQATGSWVHSLEHGYVVLLYNCPVECPDLVSQLQRFYESAPKSVRWGAQKLIVQPYRSMQHKLAIVAWDYLDELDAFDADRLMTFYNAYHDRGPEDVS